MNRNSPELEYAVREEIAQALELPLDDVALTSRLAADLGAESIDLIDLTFRLESRFNVQLPEGMALDNARSGQSDLTVEEVIRDLQARIKLL